MTITGGRTTFPPPPNFHVVVVHLVPQTVTSFGNRIIADTVS